MPELRPTTGTAHPMPAPQQPPFAEVEVLGERIAELSAQIQASTFEGDFSGRSRLPSAFKRLSSSSSPVLSIFEGLSSSRSRLLSTSERLFGSRSRVLSTVERPLAAS